MHKFQSYRRLNLKLSKLSIEALFIEYNAWCVSTPWKRPFSRFCSSIHLLSRTVARFKGWVSTLPKKLSIYCLIYRDNFNGISMALISIVSQLGDARFDTHVHVRSRPLLLASFAHKLRLHIWVLSGNRAGASWSSYGHVSPHDCAHRVYGRAPSVALSCEIPLRWLHSSWPRPGGFQSPVRSLCTCLTWYAWFRELSLILLSWKLC